MTLKEFFKSMLRSFFIIVTLINIAMLIIGKIFQPERQFGYEAFFYPVLYGLCAMIPVAVMYSKKELTVKQMLVRKIVKMVLIAVLIVFVIFGFDGIRAEKAGEIAGVGVSVIVIYVLEEVISWVINNHNAERLTERLIKYQDSNNKCLK